MNTFALLWGKLLDSSLWISGTKEDRLVWITLLCMKDKDGRVYASVVGLADRAKVSVVECRAALKRFLAPDPDDTSKVEEGRRLREIAGGWEVINHDLYRFASEARREMWRQQKAEQRARVKLEKEAFEAGKKKGLQKVVKAAQHRGEVAGRKEGVAVALHQAQTQPANLQAQQAEQQKETE